jgi:aspartyl/asparaginyl beta-hydroxylase (cupin superfamily)
MKPIKRVVSFGLAVYYLPWILLGYATCGFVDVLRNTRRTISTLDRYFAGNGVFTWLLSPFNLVIDLLCLPYRNQGVYNLADLPAAHQIEVNALIEAANRRNIVRLLEEKVGDKKRTIIFFKWYGKNLEASVDVPEYHAKYKYVRTIGVSIFNKRQSTGKHFGPLRLTLRMLYNINDVIDPNVYIEVGSHTHRWADKKLFIFDDTLQHQSVNNSDGVRYCLFVDLLRPSRLPWVLNGLLASVRAVMTPFRAVFYGHWTFIK